MTVAELIAELQRVDPSLPVRVDRGGDRWDATRVFVSAAHPLAPPNDQAVYLDAGGP